MGFIFSIELENRNVLISWKLLVLQSGYNLPRFWEVTWAHTFSPVLARNITEVEPTLLRQDQVYIEVGATQWWKQFWNSFLFGKQIWMERNIPIKFLNELIIEDCQLFRFTSIGSTWFFSIWHRSLFWLFSTFVSTGIIIINLNLLKMQFYFIKILQGS